jgi:serine/threonine protein kinase
MDAARWSEVRRVLEGALERAQGERARFLSDVCGADLELKAEVAGLLASDDPARALEPPSAGWTRPAPAALAGGLLGTRIGRYRVLRLIGFGGMGAVYEAEQDQPRRTVALKVMRSGLASPSALRRFELESQVLARLRHPFIAAVFEAGTHNPDPADPSRATAYFAMELVPDAAAITEFAKSRSLDARQRLELFAEVCDAVHHGHQQGVIHRDLKPGNVLVDADGRPRIIDFGVARTIDPDPVATHSGGQILGTLQYMSPEQCAPERAGIDTRSDVYSLGVMLYELLAGQAPYALTGASIPDSIRTVCETEPRPLSEIDRSLRGDVETIVRTAIAKDPERRYPAAASLAADIRHYLCAEPISARPPTAMYQLRTFARRNKSLVASAGAVLLVLVLGIVATSLALRSARQEASRARRIADFYKDTITAGNPYLAGSPGSVADNWWEDPIEPRDASAPWGRDAPSFAVPDLLEVAGSRLCTAFVDEPAIQAELYDTLGRTLVHMGSGRGDEFLRRALELRERELGPDSEEAIRTRLGLAVRIEGAGSFHDAESLFRAAFESCVRAFGPDDPRTLAAERRWSEGLIWLRPDEALALARRALDHARIALGDDAPLTLAARTGLSGMLATTDLREAESVAREALAGWRRVAGDDSYEAAGARATLAEILLLERVDLEAEEHLRAALPVLRAHFGGDVVHTLNWELKLIRLLRRVSRPGDAARETRRLIEEARRAFGPENHNVYKLEATLARTLVESGTELEEAERVARGAANGLTAVTGLGDLNTVFAVDALHSVIRARGRPGEALVLASKLQDDVRALGIVEPQVLTALRQTIGECQLDLGDHAAAEVSLQESWRIAEDGAAYASDPYHPRRLALIATLAGLEDVLGRGDEAARWRARLSRDPASER